MLEAMAAGCPVVASDLPVVRELAEPERHFQPARPGDAKSLAEAILSLADEEARRREMAQRARQHVCDHYTWRQSTGKLISVYEELLSGI